MTRRPEIFGHRGASHSAPENTLPAFELALSMGVDGVELDVHCSRDGELMVIHDDTLERTTNGSGAVGDFSAADLGDLDAGGYIESTYVNASIPTLRQVLDLCGNRIRINVEVKSVDPMGGDQVEPLAALIRERKLYDQVIVSSFNPVTLIKMRWFDADVALGLLHSQLLPDFLQRAWFGPLISPQALHPHFHLVDAAYVERAGELGFAVNTWTVNDLVEARHLANLGVDVIITDLPDLVVKALSSTPDYP